MNQWFSMLKLQGVYHDGHKHITMGANGLGGGVVTRVGRVIGAATRQEQAGMGAGKGTNTVSGHENSFEQHWEWWCVIILFLAGDDNHLVSLFNCYHDLLISLGHFMGSRPIVPINVSPPITTLACHSNTRCCEWWQYAIIATIVAPCRDIVRFIIHGLLIVLIIVLTISYYFKYIFLLLFGVNPWVTHHGYGYGKTDPWGRIWVTHGCTRIPTQNGYG